MTDEFALNLINENLNYIRGKVDDLDEKWEAHEKACPALKWFNRKPSNTSIPQPPPVPRAGLLLMLSRFWPLIIGASLGLLSVGAYIGSGNVSEVETKVKELTELVKKVDQ